MTWCDLQSYVCCFCFCDLDDLKWLDWLIDWILRRINSARSLRQSANLYIAFCVLLFASRARRSFRGRMSFRGSVRELQKRLPLYTALKAVINWRMTEQDAVGNNWTNRSVGGPDDSCRVGARNGNAHVRHKLTLTSLLRWTKKKTRPRVQSCWTWLNCWRMGDHAKV
jgi:hypothetical protein